MADMKKVAYIFFAGLVMLAAVVIVVGAIGICVMLIMAEWTWAVRLFGVVALATIMLFISATVVEELE